MTTFLPHNFKVKSWESLKPYYEDIKNRQIDSPESLNKYLKDLSELEALVNDDLGWRYIRMTCDTEDKKIKESYEFFMSSIFPEIQKYRNIFNKKINKNPFISQLSQESRYRLYIKKINNEMRIFRKENIPLLSKMYVKEKEYGEITGKMTVTINGEEMTLQKASNLLKDLNRSVRKKAFTKIYGRRKIDFAQLNDLFSELIGMRNRIAINAGFKDYRDYIWVELNRFDYTPQDCFNFHHSIKQEILPLVEKLMGKKRKVLGLETLKPWDKEVSISGKKPLKPFKTSEELLKRVIQCLYRLNPFFGECLSAMRDKGHLDLESRKGKAPGGYNYPLYKAGIPFIFMNTTGSFRDLTTIMHESGHAIHSFLNRDLELTAFKRLPSEIAELASMSMELFSMEHWSLFFPDKDNLLQAKLEQLERVLRIFPWVAVIDKFQHWVYTNPEHTPGERIQSWKEIYNEFSPRTIDLTGQKDFVSIEWQKQPHLFLAPFYYIEYAIAQLGAIALWKQFKQDPERTLKNYISALSLGWTKPISEVYKTAGIKFDFTQKYVRGLAEFLRKEIEI